MRAQTGIELDYLGVWNEKAYTSDYVVGLAEALRRANLSSKIVAHDNGDDIVEEMARNATLAAAVDVVGVHGWAMTKGMGANVTRLGKSYWVSEDNLVDGPAYPDGKFEAALGWAKLPIANFVDEGIVALIQCPLIHAWSQNYARHNHGSACARHTQYPSPQAPRTTPSRFFRYTTRTPAPPRSEHSYAPF